MIEDETEKEIVMAAYNGVSGGYQATYSFASETPTYVKKHLEAIGPLKAEGLVGVSHIYPKATSGRPTQSIISLTRKGVEYIEKNGLMDETTIVNHQKARKLFQEIEEAEQKGDMSTKAALEVSFRQFDDNIQACAKQYQHLI